MIIWPQLSGKSTPPGLRSRLLAHSAPVVPRPKLRGTWAAKGQLGVVARDDFGFPQCIYQCRAKKLGRIRIGSTCRKIKVFGKLKTRYDTHAMGQPFFKRLENQKATTLGRKRCSVRDWGPQNPSVKLCGKDRRRMRGTDLTESLVEFVGNNIQIW